MAELPTEIESERLTIRCWRPDDAPGLHAAIVASTEHLRPWMPWIAFEPLEVNARRELIDTWAQARVDGGDTVYGVFLDGAPIGGTGLHRRRGPGILEIGYWIHVDQVGRGFATEISAVLTDTAFAQPDVDRVEIHHDKANISSGRVPDKLGFSFVAETQDSITSPGEVGIDCAWHLMRADWLARRTG